MIFSSTPFRTTSFCCSSSPGLTKRGLASAAEIRLAGASDESAEVGEGPATGFQSRVPEWESVDHVRPDFEHRRDSRCSRSLREPCRVGEQRLLGADLDKERRKSRQVCE